MGVAARPLADLTAPLALGVAEVPARRCPRLSGRGSPRGFVEGYALSGRASACAQQPLMPCGHPVNRGAYPPPATGRGGEALEFAFPFFLRSRQANMELHCNILDRSIFEIHFTIQEPVTSLVRGHGKRNTALEIKDLSSVQRASDRSVYT